MNRDVCEHSTPSGLPCDKCHAPQAMAKPEALRLLRLLSGLESAMLCNKQSVPDYLLDELQSCAEILEREILKPQP